MRFLPKSQASTDHAPGPIIAKVNPNTANPIGIPVLTCIEIAIHNSRIITNNPASGVHKPAISKTPPSAAMPCFTLAAQEGVVAKHVASKYNRVAPTRNLWIKSPPPGQPSANVENSRCK